MGSAKLPCPVWHRQPRIRPNYGKRSHLLPTRVSQVILYENNAVELLKDNKVTSINKQQDSIRHFLTVQKKAFIVRQALQEAELKAMGLADFHLLPPELAQKRENAMALFNTITYTGGKDLPLHHRLNKRRLREIQENMIEEENRRRNRTGIRERRLAVLKQEIEQYKQEKRKSLLPTAALSPDLTKSDSFVLPDKSDSLVLPGINTDLQRSLTFQGYPY